MGVLRPEVVPQTDGQASFEEYTEHENTASVIYISVISTPQDRLAANTNLLEPTSSIFYLKAEIQAKSASVQGHSVCTSLLCFWRLLLLSIQLPPPLRPLSSRSPNPRANSSSIRLFTRQKISPLQTAKATKLYGNPHSQIHTLRIS